MAVNTDRLEKTSSEIRVIRNEVERRFTLNGNGLQLPLSGTGAADELQSPLNHYEVYTLPVAYGTCILPTATTIRIVRAGQIVMIDIAGIGVTATVGAAIATVVLPAGAAYAIPARFRPSAAFFGCCQVSDNATSFPGIVEVDAAGVITVWPINPALVFSAGGAGMNIEHLSFTYFLA